MTKIIKIYLTFIINIGYNYENVKEEYDVRIFAEITWEKEYRSTAKYDSLFFIKSGLDNR